MLKPKEIEEITALLWYIPLENLQEVRALVESLKEQCGYTEPIDDSDEWTDEDRREATNEALRRLDEIDPYDWPDSEERMDEAEPYRRLHPDLSEEQPGPLPEQERRK